MKNRLEKYDIGEWLALLVEQRLIDHGEAVVDAHEAMVEMCGDQDEDY